MLKVILDPVSRALLTCEWIRGTCFVCHMSFALHALDCAMNESLMLRGFHTQADREAARMRMHFTRADTVLAPEEK